MDEDDATGLMYIRFIRVAAIFAYHSTFIGRVLVSLEFLVSMCDST